MHDSSNKRGVCLEKTHEMVNCNELEVNGNDSNDNGNGDDGGDEIIYLLGNAWKH